MVVRRRFLVGISGAVAAVSGCVEFGGSADNGDSDTPQDGSNVGSEPDEPSYHLTAAPVEANDGLDPVLSTDDEAVAEIEPLVEVIQTVTEVFEVTRQSISVEDAEAFEALTANVEQYFAGNPPGYYFDHGGQRVSVTLGGG